MDSSFTAIEFTRIYLAVFFSAVAVFYTVRIIAAKISGQREVVFPGARLSPTWINHGLFRVFRILIWLVCLLRWPFPGVDRYLGMLDPLNIAPVVLAGDILVTAGFLFAVAVHFSLGRQWRSGIDPDGPGALVTNGFYRYSRNPMYLGVAAAQVGFFLALPSIFSGVCLLIGLFALRRQVLAEEAHLLSKHPQDYAEYRRYARRWL